jgi:nicotinate-nucleotide adenylyltransferase
MRFEPHLAVAHRPGFPIDEQTVPPALGECCRGRRCATAADLALAPAGRVVTFAMTPLAISATQIRSLLAEGDSVRYLLPDEVIAYIRAQHLYTEQ